jgi:glycosyltransferase 2 family protein
MLSGVSILIAAGFWWLLRAGAFPLVPPPEDLATAEPLDLVLFSGIWVLVLILKAGRWHWQLSPIGHVPLRRMFNVGFISSAAVLVLPLRSGELVRPALISRSDRIPFLAAVTTSAAERITDALFASVLLIVSLTGATLIEPLPQRIGNLPIPAAIVPTLGYSAAVVALAASLLVLCFYYFRVWTIRLLSATIGRFSPRSGAWVQHKLQDLTRGLEFLGSRRHSAGFLGLSAAYWCAHVGSTWLLLRRTGFPELTLAQAGVVLGTLSFGMSLPNTPGFFGVFQVAVYASLALFFSPAIVQQHGAVAVFWMYALEVGWVLTLAAVALIVERVAQKLGN